MHGTRGMCTYAAHRDLCACSVSDAIGQTPTTSSTQSDSRIELANARSLGISATSGHQPPCDRRPLICISGSEQRGALTACRD